MEKRMLSVLVLIPAFLFSCSPRKVGSLEERMQSTLDRGIARYGIHGVSATVILPDSRTWTGVSGVSHDAVNIAPDMLFAVVDAAPVPGLDLFMKLLRRGCARWWSWAVVLVTVGGLQAASITYIGKTTDRTDFHAAPQMGVLGYWFPQFNAPEPVMDRPTDEHERNGLPLWAGPLVHLDSWVSVRFFKRTFSQDGPCRSAGGFAAFNRFTLPNGEEGLSGIILDPHAADNTSNAVNRIMLGEGTPASFYLRIVVDNTGGKYNAITRLRARGDHLGTAVESDTYPKPGDAGFNGIADIYTFRFDGFVAGDFIKIQMAGMPGDVPQGGGASIGGILFDPAP